MRRVLCSILCLLTLCCSTTLAAQTDEQAIADLLKKRIELFNAREFEEMVSLFAEESREKRAELVEKLQGRLGSRNIQIENPKLSDLAIDGDAATARYAYELRGRTRQENIRLVREADGWRILDIQRE